jgi:HK97 family phage portal protein
MGLLGRALVKLIEREQKRAPLNIKGQSFLSPDAPVPLPINWRVLYSEYRRHPDVFACVREIADGVGGNGFRWLNMNDPEVEPNKQSVALAEGILTGFLPGQSPRSLLRNTTKHQMIGGNAFWALNKNQTGSEIVEAQLLPPKNISIVLKNEEVVKYLFEKPGYEPVSYEPEEIIHFAYDTDTESELWGMSPLEVLVWEVRTDLGAMFSNYAIFTQGQRGVHYILDPELTKDQQDTAIDMIKKQLGGAKNRHRAFAMAGIKEVKTLEVSPKDMEFPLLRKMATEKICAAFGVPKSIIGYRDTANEATASKTDRRNFHESTVRPIEEYFAEKINGELLPVLGINDIAFNFNPTSFDEIEDNEKRAKELVTGGLITPNEGREMTGRQLIDDNELANELLIGTTMQLLRNIGSGASSAEMIKAVNDLEKAVWTLPKPPTK